MTNGLPGAAERRPPARTRGLTARTALLAVFAAAASLALISWAGDAALRALSAERDAERAATARAAADALDRHLEEIVRHLEMLSGARGFDPGDADDRPEQAAVHETWLHLRVLDEVALLAADGRLIAAARGGRPARPPPDAVGEAVRSVRPVVRVVEAPAGGHVVHLVVPLRNWQGRVGSVAVGVLDPLTAGWPARLAAAGAGTALVDGDGHVLGGVPSGLPQRAPARARLAHAPLFVERGAAAESTAAATFRARLLRLAPAVLAVALLLAWGVARSVKAPLLVLGAAAERIAQGDLDRPVPGQGGDEVGRLAAALERMRAALAAREHDRLRGLLLGRLIAAQEDERKRIARELHDETCQTLSALAMRLDAALAAGGPVPPERLAGARALAGSALDEVHRVIHDLRPSVLDDLGLVCAIRWTATRTLVPAGVEVEFLADDEAGAPLAPDVQTALFRAAQEALANVARHAQARRVVIRIAAEDGALVTSIEDDGKGFDPAHLERPAPSGRGLGLLGMRERLELAHGTAVVSSRPGHGTRVVLSAPLPPKEQPWLASAS